MQMLYEANRVSLVQSLPKTAELDPTIGSNRTWSKEKSKLEHGRDSECLHHVGEGSSWRHYRDSVDGVAFHEKAYCLELLPAKGGTEGTEERAFALHTEECVKGEVAS